jgi:hypothetical protein
MKTPPSSLRNLAQTLPREERKREKKISPGPEAPYSIASALVSDCIANAARLSHCHMSHVCITAAPAVCCLHSCFHLPVSIGFYRGLQLRLLLLCAPLRLSSIAALPPPPPPPLNPLRPHQLCCFPASLLLLSPPCLLCCCCS